MGQIKFHNQKLCTLIIAAIGVISCLLPWWSTPSFDFLGQKIGGFSINGMHDMGIIAFLAFVAAGVVSFIGDKAKPFEAQNKLIPAACFAAAALFTLIQFIRISTGTAIGIWLSLLAGIAGVVAVYVLKPEQFERKTYPPKV